MINDKRIAKRYAKAFFHEKMGNELIEIMTEEVTALARVMKSDEDIREFFTSPVNPRKQKLKVIENIGKRLKLSAYTLRFIELLINKNRINLLPAVAEEIREISDQINELVRVKLTTAFEPSVSELKELSERISKYFGCKVIVERKIDTEVLGGFILEGDGKLMDMSVRGQIKKILSNV